MAFLVTAGWFITVIACVFAISQTHVDRDFTFRSLPEFDAFLAERANAGSASKSADQQKGTGRRTLPSMETEENDDALFGL